MKIIHINFSSLTDFFYQRNNMEIDLECLFLSPLAGAPTIISTFSNGVSRFDFELIFNNKVFAIIEFQSAFSNVLPKLYM